jgi:hypothetical protein
VDGLSQHFTAGIMDDLGMGSADAHNAKAAWDSRVLRKRYAGQPGRHAMDSQGLPYYEVHHPSGWSVRTDGSPMLTTHHRALGSDAVDKIDVGTQFKGVHMMHPGLDTKDPVKNHQRLRAELDNYVDHHAGAHEESNPKIKDWKSSVTALRTQAHAAQGQDVIAHCFRCGSGNIIGRSDGSAECSFCDAVFTVALQPQYSAFPQTIDGSPVDVPGMGDALPPDAGADGDPADPTDPNALDPNAPDGSLPGAVAPGEGEDDPDADGPPSDDEDASGDDSNVPPQFRSKSGALLGEDDYLRHVALRISDGPTRAALLAQVRAEKSG